MRVRVKMDPLFPRNLEKVALEALEESVNRVKDHILKAQTIPKRTGDLERGMFTAPNRKGYSLYMTGPYARRLYFNPTYNFYREENPNAGAKWFAPYLPGGKYEDYIFRAFAREMKRRL